MLVCVSRIRTFNTGSVEQVAVRRRVTHLRPAFGFAGVLIDLAIVLHVEPQAVFRVDAVMGSLISLFRGHRIFRVFRVLK
jgi:hypothetical protein